MAQTPNGFTVHGVLTLTPSGWTTVADLNGGTSDGQTLRVTPSTPLADVRAVRVETSQSPSWVAWREIEVLGSR